MERQRCEKAGFHVCVTCVCVCLSPSFPCAQRFSQASGPYAPSIGRYPIFNNTNYALNKHPFPLFFRRLFQYISWNQIRVKKRRFFDVISLWGVDAERVGWEIARTTITHLSHSVWIFFFSFVSFTLILFIGETVQVNCDAINLMKKNEKNPSVYNDRIRRCISIYEHQFDILKAAGRDHFQCWVHCLFLRWLASSHAGSL